MRFQVLNGRMIPIATTIKASACTCGCGVVNILLFEETGQLVMAAGLKAEGALDFGAEICGKARELMLAAGGGKA